MKKVLFSAIMAVMAFTNANAQTVVTNDYNTPITDETIQQDRGRESLVTMSLSYYNFEGGYNVGFSDSYIRPNFIGFDFNYRLSFKDKGNMNFDLGVNYSPKLWSENDYALFLTPSVGPSFRIQDGKFNVDFYFNPRLIFNYKSFIVSAGYYMWVAKANFSDGMNHGFQASLGYVF